jgi:EAL domain-containing protein (putative c-di-GMP-specific phosphodiesterase class I)
MAQEDGDGSDQRTQQTLTERPTLGPGSLRSTVIVVDDQDEVLESVARSLREYFEVITFLDARAAVERARHGGVAVIVSDLHMRRMSGLDLLRSVRRCDADLPVVLLADQPSLEEARAAIEWGAFGCLAKPVSPSALRAAVERASHLYRLSELKREAASLLGIAAEPCDRAGLEALYLRGLESLAVTFQPVFSTSRAELFGYEACVRVAYGPLLTFGSLLGVAERLGTVLEVGRHVRASVAALFANAPAGRLLFVNVHPLDLTDPTLLAPDVPLSSDAARVVLQVSDRASSLVPREVERSVAALRARGFRIAVSQLGAGPPGMTGVARLAPDLVKVERALGAGVHQSPIKQRLVGGMLRVCADLSLGVIVEGVENVEERDTLVALGCDLLQGHLFADSPEPFPGAQWD